LVAKVLFARQEGWSDDLHERSLAGIMRGMEDDEPDYSMADEVHEVM